MIEYISGTEYIEEELLGMTFRISPEAFFQVNTSGAEVLYKAAIDLAQPSNDTAVLDVCCGTGTIGLSFSKVTFTFFYNEPHIILYSITLSELITITVFSNSLVLRRGTRHRNCRKCD